MLKTSLSQLRALNPCAEGITFANVALPPGEFTAAEARAFGIGFDDLVWGIAALARKDPAFNERLQRWLDDCASHARALAGDEYPGIQRRRDELSRARDFEQGRLDAAVRAITRYAGRVAFSEANRATKSAAKAAVLAARLSGGNPRQSAVAGAEAAWTRAKRDATAREEAWQFDQLILRFGDPEPPASRLL